MESLIAIIFIVAMALLSSGKKKKGKSAKPEPVAKNAPIQSAPKAAAQLSLAEREARMKALREKRAERQAAKVTAAPQAVAMQERRAVVQGESLDDAEGCVGGSLPHDHAEGESRAEHKRHMAAYAAREAEERAAREAAPGLDLADVRRAVVMAEILGKPKALQRRG